MTQLGLLILLVVWITLPLQAYSDLRLHEHNKERRFILKRQHTKTEAWRFYLKVCLYEVTNDFESK